MNDTLNVTAPHFAATLTFKKGKVENASIHLMWMMGRTEADVKRIITQRGWTWKELTDAGSH